MFTALKTTTGTMSLDLIVWSVFIGIMIAGVMAVYNKRYLGNFVRALIAEEAFSKDKALTLEELGMNKNFLLKMEIKRGVVFKGIVYEQDDEVVICDNTAVPVYREEIDFNNARFFVPYELKHRAELKFDKKGTHIMLMVFGAIFFFALALFITSFSDEFMSFVNDILGLK